MTARYFVADDRRRGGLSWQAVWDLARTGAIGAETLILLPGASSWQQAREIEHLRELFPEASVLVASTQEQAADCRRSITNLQLAGPYSRFLARAIDYAILVPLSMILIMKASDLLSFIPLDTSGSWAIYGKVFYAYIGQIALMWLIVQLLLLLSMAFAGTSPGKAILGITVRNVKGENTRRFHLERELRIWVLVLCLGFHIAALFQVGRQYVLLRFGQPTVYDRNFAAVEGRPSISRFGLGLFTLLLLTAAAICMLVIVCGAVVCDIADTT